MKKKQKVGTTFKRKIFGISICVTFYRNLAKVFEQLNENCMCWLKKIPLKYMILLLDKYVFVLKFQCRLKITEQRIAETNVSEISISI